MLDFLLHVDGSVGLKRPSSADLITITSHHPDAYSNSPTSSFEQTSKVKMPIKPLLKGLGDLLREISLDSIHVNSDASTTPEDLITLASYNLCPKNERAIIVPGICVCFDELPEVNAHGMIFQALLLPGRQKTYRKR